MVYNESKSALNDLIWAPWFVFLTADTMTRWVTVGLWLVDND